MKIFNSHISTEQLADVADGRERISDDLKLHLSGCASCSQELASLEKAIRLMRCDETQNAPPEAVNFAVNLFRTRRQLAPRAETLTDKIAATLKIDLSAFAPAFGERSSGAAASDERQMLFSAGDYDLDLRLKKTENGFSIRGQVLGELVEKSLVRLETADFTVDSPVDEVGSFSFSPLSSVDGLQVSLVFTR